METKKISFGFSKVKKAEKVVKEEEKKDFIECLEDKSIKVFGGNVLKEEKPLVIPMMKNTKPTLEALARIAQEVESENVSVPAEGLSTKLEPKEGETLEERAAREIIDDLKNVKTEDNKVYSLPIAQSNQVEGKEATIEEYENIPITEFGLAMLRGMGWAPGKGVGKKETNVPVSQPQPRPKGLGLGADRVVHAPSDTKNKNAKGQTEELKMVKGACVKICNGSSAGSYGQISGFDEDSGRIIVELAVKKTAINISEFMFQLVSKQEYQERSRIINSVKVEEYKIKENGSNYTENKSESKHLNRSRDNSPEASIKNRKDFYNKNQREYNDQRDNKHQREQRDQRGNKDQHVHRDQRDFKDQHEKRQQHEYKDERYYKDNCDQRDRKKDKTMDSKSSSIRYARRNSIEEENTRNSRNRDKRKDFTDSNSDSNDSRHRSRKKDVEKRALRSSSSSPELQRKDKDKKRKGKKKRRDRSRSPNCRKYKK